MGWGRRKHQLQQHRNDHGHGKTNGYTHPPEVAFAGALQAPASQGVGDHVDVDVAGSSDDAASHATAEQVRGEFAA
ncbi:hypothetical protein PJL18_03675 [Paenarthrobacter nicotinovorans]|nr:hypothetical protein [Paenarthrobacter nicotinovorans]